MEQSVDGVYKYGRVARLRTIAGCGGSSVMSEVFVTKDLIQEACVRSVDGIDAGAGAGALDCVCVCVCVCVRVDGRRGLI